MKPETPILILALIVLIGALVTYLIGLPPSFVAVLIIVSLALLGFWWREYLRSKQSKKIEGK